MENIKRELAMSRIERFERIRKQIAASQLSFQPDDCQTAGLCLNLKIKIF